MIDKAPLLVALIGVVAIAVPAYELSGARQVGLLAVGVLCGIALYQSGFGFSAAWRRFIGHRDGEGLRHQFLMIGIAAVIIIPLLSHGSAFGRPLSGAIAPVGLSVLAGAALFGLGMQLGGGCGSGTLFTVGGGSLRMVITLIFFVVGAIAGTIHLPWWLTLPATEAVSMGAVVGPLLATFVTIGVLGALALATWFLQGDRRSPRQVESGSRVPARFIVGPWPLVWGAVALAALNIATLLLAGHPWSITFAFALWGAKVLQAVSIPVETWTFWTWPAPSRALGQHLLLDVTTVMNLGIVLGAAMAASLRGRFAAKEGLRLGPTLAAIIGGLLMGYGARLAFGCNIGAMFSGIASGSLHGWLWFAAAFGGSWVGVRLRPTFGLL